MPDWSKRRQRFREVLAGTTCVRPGSVFDPISARIAEDLGYETGIFAGSVASMVVLGAPDLVVLTLSEFADQAHRICRAGELPLLVDADHGYGNALNVMRTVEELEAAGVAALTIEDTTLPTPFNASGAAPMISLEEGVGKMKAALAARTDKNLIIAGRTSAVRLGGVDEAIRRAKAYAAAGVDALFFAGVTKKEEVDALGAEIKIPIMFGDLGTDVGDMAYFASRGVRVCLQGHKPFQTSIQTVHDVLKAEREGSKPDKAPASPQMLARVTRAAEYERQIKDYLS